MKGFGHSRTPRIGRVHSGSPSTFPAQAIFEACSIAIKLTLHPAEHSRHDLPKAQIEAIEAEFFDEGNDHAAPSFVKYLKQVPVARFEEIIGKARLSSNVYVVSEVVKCLRYRRCDLES